MNNDLISREALKKAVINNFDNLQAYFTKDFIEEIDNAPTVEAYTLEQVKELVDLNKKLLEERPQGEWAEFEGGYICSNCDDIEAYTPNFCPNCGALMKGGAE